SYSDAIAATGDNAAFWTKYIADSQRNIIIGAFGSAVGINMTFLLPYTLLKRGWSKRHRELSRFDLALGLFVPFIMATSFLVVATSAQFHAKKDSIVSVGNYNAVVDTWLTSKNANFDKTSDTAQAQRDALPDADQQLAAMVAKRTAKDLAKSLEPALGKNAQLIFGIGILAMAISTMIVHMMMNGYAISEAFGKPGQKALFMIGAAMPALSGFFSPILWTGNPDIKTTLNIPAGTIATTLLPIAYLIFILLMNSRKTLGDEMPRKRSLINILMLIAGGLASFAAVWNLIGRYGSKDPFMHNFGMIGLVALPTLLLIGIFGFIRNNKSPLS
ncbi:MAG: divalent metal cation transporter, partial [Akkermansiaceae bacterium]|nr:divalent metal cation transporter [Akkermansiaceae bacterium]